MPACIHGNVCRVWMRMMNCGKPLAATCPNGCAYFESKRVVQDEVVSKDAFNKLYIIALELAKKQGTSERD